jgi:hypothetical protein
MLPKTNYPILIIVNRDVIEMPYRWMLVVRKSNFVPLALGIQPLPAHLARKPDSRKELEAAVPVAGSAFGDSRSPYQWAEFETVDEAKNQFAPPVRVNLAQEEQVWHYLGTHSTESRAQYTHNPSVPVHNPRANFLDSVKSLGVAGGVNVRASKIPPHRPFHYAATAPAPPYQQNLYAQHRPPLLLLQQQQNQHLLQSALNAANFVAPHLQSSSSSSPRPPSSAAASSLQHLAPPPAPAAATGAAAAGPAMPSAFRTLPNSSIRHAPYPTVAKSHAQQQHHLTSTNTFANVRDLIARRRLAQITEHANVFAGYTIVSPELVVETLLGPMGSIPPLNGLEKLELAMAQQRVQPRAADGTLLPPQTLNMRADEVARLLQMLRFSLVSHRERLDVIHKKESEGVKQEIVDQGSVAAARMPGKYAFLDQQRAKAPNVYQSPYNMPSGLSEYAKTTYGLIPSPDDPQVIPGQ